MTGTSPSSDCGRNRAVPVTGNIGKLSGESISPGTGAERDSRGAASSGARRLGPGRRRRGHPPGARPEPSPGARPAASAQCRDRHDHASRARSAASPSEPCPRGEPGLAPSGSAGALEPDARGHASGCAAAGQRPREPVKGDGSTPRLRGCRPGEKVGTDMFIGNARSARMPAPAWDVLPGRRRTGPVRTGCGPDLNPAPAARIRASLTDHDPHWHHPTHTEAGRPLPPPEMTRPARAGPCVGWRKTGAGAVAVAALTLAWGRTARRGTG